MNAAPLPPTHVGIRRRAYPLKVQGYRMWRFLVVIPGLDPGICLQLKDRAQSILIPGSSPGMTNLGTCDSHA